MNNRLLKQQTVNTINKMEDFAEGNHLKFKSLFVALVRSLKTTLIETASLSFDSFLAYMEKLENEKQFDE